MVASIRFFILGQRVPSKLSSLADQSATRLRNRQAISKAVCEASNAAATTAASLAWIASDRDSVDSLLEEAIGQAATAGSRRHRLGNLVLLDTPRLATLASAQNLFATVAWTVEPQHWLPLPEMMEVMSDADARDYVVGGMVDLPTQSLTLYRGDLSLLSVPVSILKPTGENVRPDLTDFEVIDCGQAIRLGSYEAVAGAIFYETDPEYRKRYRARMREQDNTFGASLRRLRLQRGLRQSDFRPLPDKTIARIESGQVQKPHGNTLSHIAATLKVEPESIETY